VIKRANAKGVVVVPFDNVLDSDEVMMVNEDQLAMGQQSGEWVVKNIPSKTGKLLEVRGVPGNSVDRDRHLGFRKVVEAPGNKFEVVEVVGNWDDGTAQKAVADAVAVHKNFDGMFVQGGSTGAVRALIDAKHHLKERHARGLAATPGNLQALRGGARAGRRGPQLPCR
jgi:ribose transport system substrate-binding protein